MVSKLDWRQIEGQWRAVEKATVALKVVRIFTAVLHREKVIERD